MAAPVYPNGVSRNANGITPDPRQLPEVVAREVIEETVKASTALSLFRTIDMGTATHRLPVLDTFPVARWLTGADQTAKDSAVKTTTGMSWKNVTLTAEEIAVIVPISDAYIADTGLDLFSEIKPRLAESFGKAIDEAVFFGVNKPTTWPTHIYAGAVAAGNSVTAPANLVYTAPNDLGVDIANVTELVELDGFTVGSYITRPALEWPLRRARSSTGEPIFDASSNGIYGRPFQYVQNGAWDTTKAHLITGDWSKAIMGVRQDLTFKLFDQGVLSDGAGNVVWSAMENDGMALRAVMRVAYAVANPSTRLNGTTQYPFAVLRTNGGPAS
jgi:HK97 family phage major capsid protein